MMKKVLKVSIFLILFASLIYGIDYCSDKSFNKKMDTLKLNGKVVKKYVDKKDHNRLKLIILENKYSITLDLVNETSGLYDYIQVGDSIRKIENKRDVRIYNTNKDSIFVMSF